jgi:hypothetical protein
VNPAPAPRFLAPRGDPIRQTAAVPFSPHRPAVGGSSLGPALSLRPPFFLLLVLLHATSSPTPDVAPAPALLSPRRRRPSVFLSGRVTTIRFLPLPMMPPIRFSRPYFSREIPAPSALGDTQAVEAEVVGADGAEPLLDLCCDKEEDAKPTIWVNEVKGVWLPERGIAGLAPDGRRG